MELKPFFLSSEATAWSGCSLVQPEVRADGRHDDLGAALCADAQLLRHVAAAGLASTGRTQVH